MEAVTGIAESALMKSRTTAAQGFMKAKGSEYSSFEELKGAAKGLEKLFIGYMFKAMRKAVDKNKLINSGRGEQVFQDYLDNQYAEKTVENSDFGIARMVVESLTDTLSKDEQVKAENYVNGLTQMQAARKAYEEVGDA